MENVVILKRGEPVQPKVTAALEAPPLPAAAKSGAQAEKAVAAAAGTHVTTAQKAGMGNDAVPVKKAEAAQRGADATKPEVLADQRVPPAKEEEAVVKRVLPVAAAGARKMPPTRYSGPSFAAAPEPRELPIPVLLLKGRGARLRPRDHERAALA